MRITWLRILCLSLLSASVGAQEAQRPRPLFDAADPAIARRIMLSVAPPGETLGAQLVYYGGAYAPPGTSPGAAALGTVLGLLLITGMEDSKARTLSAFAAGVKNALSQLDMTHELADSLRSEIGRTAHLEGSVLEHVSDPSDLEQPGLLVRIEERDIFTLDVRCDFGRQTTSLHLFTRVRLWRKDDPRPLYDSRLHYISRGFGDEEEARRRWLDQEGELLKRAIREGISETARMFIADVTVRAGLRELPAETSEATWIAAQSGTAVAGTVHVLMQTEERVIGQAKAPTVETLSYPKEHAARF